MPDMSHALVLTAGSPVSPAGQVSIPAIRTPVQAVAVFPYHAQLGCDLTFEAGE